MKGVFRFKSWFLNALGLIHGGAYYWNFTVHPSLRHVVTYYPGLEENIYWHIMEEKGDGVGPQPQGEFDILGTKMSNLTSVRVH